MPTPRGSHLSREHRQAISAGIKKAVKEGRFSPGETGKKYLADACKAFTPELRKLSGAKAAETMRNRPQPMDSLCGKHAGHHKAKEWSFYNVAEGRKLAGRNLSQLIRDHEHYFDPADIVWVDHQCRAALCLRSLVTTKGRTRNSWKGWMAGTGPDPHST